MMSKKELLAKVIDRVLPDTLYRYASKMGGRKKHLSVLAYHRVLDFDDSFPFDIELISASCSQFEEQISYLSKYYNVITLEYLVDCIYADSKLPENAVLITFDDGFEDNYRNAFPILKKYGVPATIFISTDFISSDQTLWFDQLSYLVLNVEQDDLETILSSDFENKIVLTDRRTVLEQVMEYVKNIPDTQRRSLLDSLFEKYSFAIRDKHKSLSSTLSWEQVREMDQSVVSFGSHTMSHPILSQLEDTELRTELEKSRLIIETELNHPVDCIAYPVGTRAAFNKKVEGLAMQAGYKLGFSYISGINELPMQQLFDLKRLHVERYTSFPLFKSMLAFPLLMAG